MLKEKIVYDLFIAADGHIRERERTEIWKDGKLFSFAYTDSQLIAPGAPTDGRQERTKEITKIIHTPEVIAEYEAKMLEL